MRGIESLAGDLCTVWVIGWLRSTLRIRDIVSLWTRSWVLRVSCDVWCYRWQRFKPFGLISTCLVGYTIPQVAEVSNPLACWTVFLVCEILQVAEVQTLWSGSCSYRGLLLTCGATGSTGSNPVGLQLVWKLKRVGSNPVAWVDVFWRVSA